MNISEKTIKKQKKLISPEKSNLQKNNSGYRFPKTECFRKN